MPIASRDARRGPYARLAARAASAALGAGAILALAPVVAAAATVRIEEPDLNPVIQPQRANLIFEATAGEANRVSVAPAGEDASGRIRYALRDTAAGITAGAGCSGGPGPGEEIICVLSRSRPASGCNRLFCADYGRRVSLSFALGDGDDEIDTTTLGPDGGDGLFEVSLDGGDGGDRISSGETLDSIAPGPGADRVSSGAGDDSAEIAEASADGPDLVDLGAGFDRVSYLDALSPIQVSLDDLANDGAADEFDNVIATEWVYGGAAADLLIGNDRETTVSQGGFAEILDGARGADVIMGNGGDDYLYGGGIQPLSGDDSVSGGAGDDVILSGDGEDEVDAGAGRDLITLGSGSDRASGGGGRDEIGGGGGGDRLRGGDGADKLFAGSRFTDTDRDRVNCGRGSDQARAEPRDVVRACERVSDVN